MPDEQRVPRLKEIDPAKFADGVCEHFRIDMVGRARLLGTAVRLVTKDHDYRDGTLWKAAHGFARYAKTGTGAPEQAEAGLRIVLRALYEAPADQVELEVDFRDHENRTTMLGVLVQAMQRRRVIRLISKSPTKRPPRKTKRTEDDR